jgi:hypothetical protein
MDENSQFIWTSFRLHLSVKQNREKERIKCKGEKQQHNTEIVKENKRK